MINRRRLLFLSPDKLFPYVLALLLVMSMQLGAREESTRQEKEVDDTEGDSSNRLHILINDGRVAGGIGEVEKDITPSANSVILPERLRGSSTSLPEVLEQEVGVQTRPTGGEGSLTTVVLRGASNEQVIIYLDGVPLNDASGGPVDLSFIPVDLVERIEIYRGSTPIELSNPSIGGAVNIITRGQAGSRGKTLQGKISQENLPDGSASSVDSSQISAGIGSFQTYKFNASSLISSQQDDFLFSGSYLSSKNDYSFVNTNGTQFNPADDRVEKRNNDAVEQLSLLANWKHRFNQKYDSEVRLDILDRDKGIPSVTNSPDVSTSIDTRQFNLLGQLNIHQAWLSNIDVNLKLFATQKTEIFDDSLAQIGFFNQHTESVTRKLGTQFYARLDQSLAQWKVLASVSQETYDTKDFLSTISSGENTRNRLELSAENISYFDSRRFIVNFILRYQRIDDGVASVTDNTGAVTPAFDKNFQFLDPQLGARYRFNRQTYVKANIGVYNRAPSFLEIFGGGGLLLGNPDLEQERSVNTDIGLTYTWFKPYSWLHNMEIYGGVFYNRVENLIVRIFNGQGIGVPENISDAVVQGVESTLAFTPAPRHSFNANISFIDSINKTDITSFKDKALPGYYQQSLSLRYAYSPGRWLYSVEADLKRNMFYDRSNLLQGDDVNLLNLGLRRYFQHANIDFRINNILDENIQYFRNRPTPGLNVALTYNHTF